MIGLALAVMLSGATQADYIRSHYPAAIQPLMLREAALNDQCRGETREAMQQRTCASRDKVIRDLKAKGWCWGSTNPDAVGSELTFLRCSRDRYGQ